MNIVQAMLDPMILGRVFSGDSWAAWRALLAGAFALPMNAHDAEIFTRLTGRAPLSARCRELLVIAGRRGGKSDVAAAIAVYLACMHEWALNVGERGVVLILAADRAQADVCFRYVCGLLEQSDILRGEIVGQTNDTVDLRMGITIQVGTSDKSSVRGRTLVACILDELSFWQGDPEEVLRALRPAMATQRDAAMIISISTAYSMRGPVYETYRKSYGVDDPHTLVIKATTRDLNPMIDQSFIDSELARDPQANAAEYLSVFRSDIEGLFDIELIDRLMRAEPREIPYRPRTVAGEHINYFAGIDVSGGRQDAAAAAIAYRDGDTIVIAAARRWPSPHDPVLVAAEVAAFLRSYNLSSGIADQYGAEIARSVYASAGIALIPSEVTRSESYLHLLPLATSARVEFPDDPTLRTELLALERRTGRTKAIVDHPPGGHDDLANAVSLAAYAASRHTTAVDWATAIFAAASPIMETRAGLAGLI